MVFFLLGCFAEKWYLEGTSLAREGVVGIFI